MLSDSVKISPRARELLRELSRRTGRTAAQLVELALYDYWANQGGDDDLPPEDGADAAGAASGAWDPPATDDE